MTEVQEFERGPLGALGVELGADMEVLVVGKVDPQEPWDLMLNTEAGLILDSKNGGTLILGNFQLLGILINWGKMAINVENLATQLDKQGSSRDSANQIWDINQWGMGPSIYAKCHGQTDEKPWSKGLRVRIGCIPRVVRAVECS